MALLMYLCLQELTLLASAVIWQNPISGPGLGLRERRGESLQSLLFDFSLVDAVIDPVLVRCTAPEWCAPGLVLDGGCVEGNRGPVSLLVLDALPWFYILRPNVLQLREDFRIAVGL